MSTARSRVRRRRVILGLIILLGAVLGGTQYLRHWRAQNLIAEIEAGNGIMVLSTSEWTRWLGQIPDQAAGGDGREGVRGAMVRLAGATFDNHWVRERGYLRDTPIISLTLHESPISGTDLAQFVNAHPLRELRAGGVAMPVEVFDGISQQAELRVLYIRGAGLTDEQFERLPLEQYEKLYIEQTAVTASGLRHLSRCSRLNALGIDGRQLDDESAATLALMPALIRLELVGQDVTDEQVSRLLTMPKLEWLALINTSVTADGFNALQAGQPGCFVEGL
jgi:hypothetical protein